MPKVGLALVDKRVDTFADILSLKHFGEQVSLDLQAGVQGGIQAPIDGLLDRAQRHTGHPGYSLTHVFGSRQGLTGWHDFVRQPNTVGFLSAYRIANVHQFFRNASPYQPGQALCPTSTGEQAEFDFRLPQLGIGSDDAQVTGHGQFQTATKRQTIDRSNSWLAQMRDLIQARMQRPRQSFSPTGRYEGGKLFDVETSTEGALALTSHNRNHNISIGG